MPKCPECDAEITVGADAVKGEIVSCPDCGAELEVRETSPVALALAPEPLRPDFHTMRFRAALEPVYGQVQENLDQVRPINFYESVAVHGLNYEPLVPDFGMIL